MKKFILLGLFIFLIGFQLASASDECSKACWERKNAQLDLLKQERAELAFCRPNYLSCVLETKEFANCKENYIQCDRGGKKSVLEKTIIATNVYNSCVAVCAAPIQLSAEMKPISFSTTCMKLFEIKSLLTEKFNQEQIKKILSLNNCPANNFFETI